MVQRGEGLGFALEPRDPLRVLGERLREDLDRDPAIEFPIARAVAFAHPTRAERRENLV